MKNLHSTISDTESFVIIVNGIPVFVDAWLKGWSQIPNGAAEVWDTTFFRAYVNQVWDQELDNAVFNEITGDRYNFSDSDIWIYYVGALMGIDKHFMGLAEDNTPIIK